MLGPKTGFCKRLKEELKKELICHHCISHRLQLILRGVNYSKSNAPLCTNCVKMEKINNKIGQFTEQVLLKQYIYLYIYCFSFYDIEKKYEFLHASFHYWHDHGLFCKLTNCVGSFLLQEESQEEKPFETFLWWE